MTGLFLKVFNMSLTASWLILAVVFLRYLLKKAPRNSICLLWALVAIRLLCPFSIESAFSLVPTRAEIITEEVMYDPEPTIETGIAVIDDAIAPLVGNRLTPHPGDSVNPIQVYTILGSWLWLIGIAGMMLYVAISWLRLCRQVAPALGLKENIYLCDAIDTPFILGLFHPHIYLPSTLGEREQRHVLAHEQAHLQRRDHLWKPLGYGILVLHWFNPLCWLAYSLLCKDIELACDEKVIRSMTPEYKKAYSEALLSCSVPAQKIMACPLAFGEVGVKTRIQAVLTHKKPAFWLVAVAVLACVATAVFFMTDPHDLPDESMVFDKTYEPFRTVYASPPLTKSDYEPYYLPTIHITDQKELLVKNEEWESIGFLQAWELTKTNFDVLFSAKSNVNGPWSWPEDEAWFRRNNCKAWRVVDESEFYIILLQNNGGILLCHGYYDAEGETDPYSDDSSARWMTFLRTQGDPFQHSDSIHQWTYNITETDIDWISVHDWREDRYYTPDAAQIKILVKILRNISKSSIYDGDFLDSELSVMVKCFEGEYLLQYADGLTQVILDTASAERYPDKHWVIEDERLSQWMERWISGEASDPVQWAYQPHLSSDYPAFPVFFDFDFTKLNLSGPNGTRQLIIGGVLPSGTKVYSGGNGFCWSPMTEDGDKELIALTSEVKIEVVDEAGERYEGILYFEVGDLPDKDPMDWANSAASSLALPVYTVRLESEELYITENPDGEGILLSRSY